MRSDPTFEHVELSGLKAPDNHTTAGLGNEPTLLKGETVDHGAETQLHRSLGTRHLTMIALGSAIGMGMWLGSGKSLANGGPASLFIGVLASSSIVWSISHSIGEMAVMYPLPSGFVQWSSIFISPAAGFALGWGYWFSYWITIANELQGVVTVLSYWTDEVPKAAWITIFWVFIILINVWVVRFFAEVEVFSSTVKFGWMFIAIVALIVVTAGGAPQGAQLVFDTGTNSPSTTASRGSLASSQLDPFGFVGSLMITLTVDPKDPNLFGGSGSNASPFVIAFRNAGIPVMAHITNAVIFVSVVSTGSISGYGGSRMLMGLAHVNMNQKIFGKADKMGRPWAGYIATIGIGGALAYLNVSHTGAEVFAWLSNLVSLLTLFGWGMISLCHLRFRYAWQLQGRSSSHLPWKTWTYPYATWWALIWCAGLILAEFYLSVWPLRGETSVQNFFANYVSVVAVAVIWVAAQVWYHCPVWVDARDIDLDACRRFYASGVDEENGPIRKGLIKKLRIILE